ncbi:Xaa-Pro aminopeptidase [Halomonas daqingensis]|uniref:Xaa-Pro aminopeptidase n=1 Tax=Billgrantia desiderata TaxID=52021 RepID=A0ABS9BA51_9GAMM|nr:Xaa-Pro aminopeptidase [Halomonas desiderata]MCE8010287.1 Xaa-Pro aminopeptidase [Halomonas desiderata]MCE8029937.1 Xaa-Pro aminopeptidase [Halomonas desiderata]MCE8044475.1 Xaa-Pro aminopeptidase [Halomonas desiderata]MCE8049091.1 Xaa-Pro aminopeptidase [Halomonas desiderata]NIC38161.1 Xaa-Pro aminopeptidase [Halomonas desiderata]
MLSAPLPRPEPIGNDEYRARRQALMAQLPTDGAVLLPGAGLVTRSRDSDYPFRQNSDLHYLTGFAEPDALLLLLPGRSEGESVLFCQDRDPSLEAWNGIRLGAEGAVREHGLDQAFENAERDERLDALLDGRTSLYLMLGDTESMALADEIRERLAGRVRRGACPPQRYVDLAPLLHEMRLIKSEAELALMRHAAGISARAHRRAMLAARPGLAEYHLQAELEHEFRWHGGSGPAYASIVGGGANACVLHYIENDAPLRDGELVLIDAGAEFDLYAGDITRTFPVGGRFSEAQRELYELVLAAQERAVAAVRPGATLVEIHDGVVRDLTAGLIRLGLLQGEVEARIEDESYKRFYLHSTSHWLGLDVHDVGSYRLAGKPRPLEAGMVLTVEPGLYVPADEDIPLAYRGIGIRIEDDVAVTAEGHEVLTADVPKRVAEIEALMASE